MQNANLERALTALTSKMGVDLEPVEVSLRLPKELEALKQAPLAPFGALKPSPPEVQAPQHSCMRQNISGHE